MTTNVDPFIQPIPQKFMDDPELRAWCEYLHNHLFQQWTRTGGSEDVISNISIEERYAWDLSVNFAREESLNLPQVSTEQPKEFNAVSTSVNYTACDYDFINAKNTSKVTLPKYPQENAVVIIRNGDGTKIDIDGNGKKINNENTGRIYRKGTALTLQYFINDDEWFAR